MIYILKDWGGSTHFLLFFLFVYGEMDFWKKKKGKHKTEQTNKTENLKTKQKKQTNKQTNKQKTNKSRKTNT